MNDDAAELVQRASRGDALAIDELIARHLPDLRRYVERRISPALLARESGSDVVQSVCREVLTSLGAFEYRGDAAFRVWLQRLALRKLVDHQRRLEAQKRDGERTASPSAAEWVTLAAALRSPSGEAELREEIAALQRGLALLSDEDRRLVRWVHLEGRTHAEVAARLGCTEVASRKQLSRALARLARLMG